MQIVRLHTVTSWLYVCCPSVGLRDEGGGGEALMPLLAGFLAALTLLSYFLQ